MKAYSINALPGSFRFRAVLRPVAIATILCFAVSPSKLYAADTAQKLTSAQIRAKFAGMEMTDGAHWTDDYDRNGTLRDYSMGKKTVGKWRAQKDELCLDLGDDPAAGSGCYEVWVSPDGVELRPTEAGMGSPMQGTVRTQSTSK